MRTGLRELHADIQITGGVRVIGDHFAQCNAFTFQARKTLLEVTTPVLVCASHNQELKRSFDGMMGFIGLWDTGATGSVITQSVAAACQLHPISFANVHHVGGKQVSPVYLVNLALPNNLIISNLRVVEGDVAGADLLIGMDVICMGDFAITNRNGITTFSFRIPSVSEIDFVEECKIAKENIQKRTKRAKNKKKKQIKRR